MALYEVCVTRERSVSDEVTLVIRAKSPAEARLKAGVYARKHEATMFNDEDQTIISVGGAEKIDFEPDCEIVT